MIKRLLERLRDWLDRKLTPSQEELILRLVMGTASLELKKGERVVLAPIPGTCGPFFLTGNSLPVFEYTVFEKKLMEFIRVRVEVARPDRIAFTCWIESTDEKVNGQKVEATPKYQAPFHKLASNLYRYFPLYAKPDSEEVEAANVQA